jgi:hypothetical protein
MLLLLLAVHRCPLDSLKRNLLTHALSAWKLYNPARTSLRMTRNTPPGDKTDGDEES